MNEHPQHEFDDELLSAYLDNELSNDERARVESHLASDPAARHLLEQLRNVSQSVRELPVHSAADGLHDSILNRIEAIRTPPPLAPHSSLLAPRTWFWASCAVAAALLIMFLQPGSESETDVAMVAKTEPQASEPLANKDTLLADATPSQVSRQRSLSEPASPSPPSDWSLQRPVSGTEQQTTASAPPAPNDFVIVHIAATRHAIQNNSFENLLRTNGVAFETVTRDSHLSAEAKPKRFSEKSLPATSDGRGLSVDQSSPVETSQPTDENSGEAPIAQESHQAEVIFVEAPRDTLESFLTSLNHDATNYAGIAVEAPSSRNEATLSFDAEQKPAFNFSKFNRGNVPRIAPNAPAPDYYRFFAQEANTASQDSGAPLGDLSGMKLGTAKRLQDNPTAPPPAPHLPAPLSRQGGLGEGVSTKAESPSALQQPTTAPNDDRIQVLFVIQPTDTPAPTLKAKNPR